MTQATDLLRRSFCYRRLDALGANYAEINRGAAPLDFGDAEAETEAAKAMALADLSMLPRTGFKGSGTPEWLADQGVKVPEESNRTTRQEGGALAARLAPAELLILGDESGDGALIDKLNAAWWAEPRPPETPRGFPVPRQDSHAWFLVSGARAAEMFAKICAVDLRPHKFEGPADRPDLCGQAFRRRDPQRPRRHARLSPAVRQRLGHLPLGRPDRRHGGVRRPARGADRGSRARAGKLDVTAADKTAVAGRTLNGMGAR